MDDNKEYIVKDIDGFIEKTRVFVYNLFGNNQDGDINTLSFEIEDMPAENLKEMNACLSTKESTLILEDYATYSKKNDKIKITNDQYMQYVSALSLRLTGNIMRVMSDKGLIEVGFDSETDDFIFWKKEN